MHVLLHTHPFLDRDWGRSGWPQRRLWFLILIPHTVVKKRRPRVPWPSVREGYQWLLPGMNLCTCTVGLAPPWNKHKLVTTSQTEAAFCCEAELFVWTLVQALCFETKLWAKRLSSLREVGTLHIFILTIVLLILCQLASHPPFYK